MDRERSCAGHSVRLVSNSASQFRERISCVSGSFHVGSDWDEMTAQRGGEQRVTKNGGVHSRIANSDARGSKRVELFCKFKGSRGRTVECRAGEEVGSGGRGTGGGGGDEVGTEERGR